MRGEASRPVAKSEIRRCPFTTAFRPQLAVEACVECIASGQIGFYYSLLGAPSGLRSPQNTLNPKNPFGSIYSPN